MDPLIFSNHTNFPSHQIPDHQDDENWASTNRSHANDKASNDLNYNQIAPTANTTEPNSNAFVENNAAYLSDTQNNQIQSRCNHSQAVESGDDEAKQVAYKPSEADTNYNDDEPQSSIVNFETIPSAGIKDCEYLKLVVGFKRTLVLPDVFFSYDTPVCYCLLCSASTGKIVLKGTEDYTKRLTQNLH